MTGSPSKRRTSPMPIESRPAESRAFHRIAVAARRAMAARQYELESARPRLAKQGDRVVGQANALRVLLHMGQHLFDEIRIVQPAKNLFDHCLLIGGLELANLLRHNA